MSHQEQFLNVIDRDEAQRRFHAALRLEPLELVIVDLSEALGRVLAADIRSEVDVPSFDRSNFDGFAVRASDTFGAEEEQPRQLRLLDEVIATAVVPESEIGPGLAASIATGAMLPRGADAVVMVEHADVDGDNLLVRRPVTPGFGVAFAGTDISSGETVLRRGERLTSRETGVLAAIGINQIPVWRQPRVGVISTGDEIVPPGAPMRPGLIFDSNARIVSDAVREAGGEPIELGIVNDDADLLRRHLNEALGSCDLVVMSGGTSKGAGDLCYRVVSELSDPGILAHGVALKPGKPICLAASQDKPVVVLPGFPTSAIFTFHEFVAPVIRQFAGRSQDRAGTVVAEMPIRVNSEVGRTEYLLVGLVPGDGDTLAAYPMGKGSGSVTTFSRADGFVTIPRRTEIVDAGSSVEVKLLGRDLQVADLVVIGSHCVGLDFLLGVLQDRGFHTKFMAVGSMAGLQAARRAECDLAGIHLLDPASGQYNRPFLGEGMELLEGYGRLQGVVYRPGDPRFDSQDASAAIDSVKDDPNCMMVNRNQGSGTRVLIDRLLDGTQPNGYAVQSRNHNAVAASVAQGRADWGVGIKTVADDAGLGFLPLTEERFDFVVPGTRSQRPAVQAMRRLLEDDEIRQHLQKMGFHVGRE